MCVNICKVKDEKMPAGPPAGTFFAEQCGRRFLDLDPVRIDQHRKIDIYHLRIINGQAMKVKIVPLMSAAKLHPVALKTPIRLAQGKARTHHGGLDTTWADLQEALVRDNMKKSVGGTDWENIVMVAIDKGEVNTITAHVSVPTQVPGFDGRAEPVVYYGSGVLDAQWRKHN
ncbi:hypothetical protein JCM8202_000050 [Rhodotorula sphaerocarpa]